MIGLIQRVLQASVSVENSIKGQIGPGILALLGIHANDTAEDADWLASKVAKLRIFEDESGRMNHSLCDTGGDIIVVSQFTLLADTRKGNRPSYIHAARPEIAEPLYQQFVKTLAQEIAKPVQTGVFGVHMHIALINDGPTTLWIDTKTRS